MRPNEIKGARIRLGFNQSDMARILGISISSYQGKECGARKFTPDETVTLVKTLQLSLTQFNDALYGGRLPYGKEKER